MSWSYWALLLRSDDIYFPTTINTLIEQDLKKLALESEKKEVDNDGDAGEEEEEAEEEEEEEDEEDESEKADGDSEKGGTEELVAPGFPHWQSPGFPYNYDSYEMLAKPQDSNSDDDDLVLGVRIYTQGGAVVSVTGQVVGEEIVEEDEVDNTAKDKEDDKNLKEATGKEAKKVKDKKKNIFS